MIQNLGTEFSPTLFINKTSKITKPLLSSRLGGEEKS